MAREFPISDGCEPSRYCSAAWRGMSDWNGQVLKQADNWLSLGAMTGVVGSGGQWVATG